MDAEDSVLVKRYKETRRSYPLASNGRVDDGIRLERQKWIFFVRELIILLIPVTFYKGSCARKLERRFFVNNENSVI